jgi:uncharacterized protein
MKPYAIATSQTGSVQRRICRFLNPLPSGVRLKLADCSSLKGEKTHGTHRIFTRPEMSEISLNAEGSGLSKPVPITINLPRETAQSTDQHVGVLLAHGAGGDMHSGNLPTLAKAFAESACPVLRFTAKGSSVPNRARVASALLQLAREGRISPFPKTRRWIFAGHSMGARVAAQLAADLQSKHDDEATVVACIFFSFPLHPPGKNELRDEPLVRLKCPLLFVRGTRDAFSERHHWENTLSRVESRSVMVHSIEGGNHQLLPLGGRAAHAEALKATCAAISEFVSKVSSKTQNANVVKKQSRTQMREKQPLNAEKIESAEEKSAKKKRRSSKRTKT